MPPKRKGPSKVTGLPGWDRLRHGGLLFDARRSAELRRFLPDALPAPVEDELRRLGTRIRDDADAEVPSSFVTFVLTKVCGFTVRSGSWLRGNAVLRAESRRAVTGEMVKPRQLWTGANGARLPVFHDDAKRLGIGKSRRSVSRVVEWLRAGNEHLALLTNGRQWRLLFAGLDYDAWCEWDLESWFDEGELADEVTTLRTLLSPPIWTPEEEGADSPLLKAVRDTRKGQAEISEVLGERVREAVEILIRGHGEALKSLGDSVEPADIYRAACRVVMRMVVILYAESRELLPRGQAIYDLHYGLGSLRERLERDAAAGRALDESRAAWPRVLALFRLVREGSTHPELLVPEYGGNLFEPGGAGNGAANDDGLSRALFVFENAGFDGETLFDSQVHRMLEKLTRTTIRVRQGRGSVRVAAPVDFSDLSSEYLGVLYEGLLDYELKTAPEDDAVLFLAVGSQPALPLARLEAMDDKALAALFDNLKKKGAASADADEESEPEAPDAAPEAAADDSETEALAEEEAAAPERTTEYRTRADRWARRAVVAAKLVRKLPKTAAPERRLAHDRKIAAEARRLTARLVPPGEWYLVRWGGTRKGSGSFYTRPGLAIPTVQRTLRPLAYDPPVKNGAPNRDAPAAEWTPKRPEDILALTVCDPACGSGTFPLAALRFLTDAVYASLWHHRRLRPDGETSLDRLLGLRDDERPDGDRSGEELLPCRPDEDRFEPRLKAILRRYVVERCIYAVDLDPLAVELCRLALWIETMDRELPFGFLDHKIKCGNALIGAWFDTFRHYPVMAWKNREGGDEKHTNGVHFRQGARTKKIKAFREKRLKPDLRSFLAGETLFQPDLLAKTNQAHDEAQAALQLLHSSSVRDPAALAERYRTKFLDSPDRQSLKEAMDLWCACWFWPADDLDSAPLPTSLAEPSPSTRQRAGCVAAEMRFFHWELEFPDVFREESDGFDAVLGNPPWENPQSNPEEFFSNYDPLFRTYGRLEKGRWQRAVFESSRSIEDQYLRYVARFKFVANWVRHCADPFGDPEGCNSGRDTFPLGRGGRAAHRRWRSARGETPGYADARHPFRLQMGRVFSYQLFTETCLALTSPRGRTGIVVPSGIYSDAWSLPLRNSILRECRWEWLFSIENRARVFPIDSRYKYNPVVVEKGSTTHAIRAAFMRRDVDDWERAEEIATPYSLDRIVRLSPTSQVILEVRSDRDLALLSRIYGNSVFVGDETTAGWGLRYELEFMMNTDAHRFPPLPDWETDGYRADEYGRWLRGEWHPIGELASEGANLLGSSGAERPDDGLLMDRADIPEGIVLSRDRDTWIGDGEIESVSRPFYEGRMIGQFNTSEKGWVSGKGRSAVWREIEIEEERIEPQYLMSEDRGNEDAGSDWCERQKVAVMDITSATNTRTMIATPLTGVPCGHSIGVVNCRRDFVLPLSAVLNSFAYDYCLRVRLSGLHTSWFILEETPLPMPGAVEVRRSAPLVSRLVASAQVSAFSLWRQDTERALTDHERLRLRTVLDVLMFSAYRLDLKDARYILRSCDLPAGRIAASFSAGKLDAKGFWRVDRDKDPELRHTVLTIIAFHDLQAKIEESGGDRERGIEAFLNQNDGEGWMLPETLRLADYGLGHDDRAQHPQPVRSRLGPRFYDWQLAQTPEERWRETRLHARNLLGAKGYGALLAERIERRLADGKDYLDLLRLTDDWERRLAGDPGQVAMLAELYARKVPDPPGWWDWITALRADGHLSDEQYRRLLDELLSRALLTEPQHTAMLHGAPPPLLIPPEEATPLAAEPKPRFELRPQRATKPGALFE